MNRNLYNGLKTIAATLTDYKYIGMWNNQLTETKNGSEFDKPRPWLLFEFVSSQVDSVGGGVQVFDPLLIRMHTIAELFDAADGTNELNLAVFDLTDKLYKKFQLNQVTGADYGTSPLNRTEVEVDSNHDNLYHHITTFTTTWVDNSATLPIGGYEIDPVLQADITTSFEDIPVPTLVVSVSSIDFGDIASGGSAIETFTISGTDLPKDNVLLTLGAASPFSLSLDDSRYSETIQLATADETLDEITVYAKFSPLVTGSQTQDINYGIPGANGTITLIGNGT